MTLTLSVTAGPFAGNEFPFDGHDTFLVGRSKDAHLQLSHGNPFFSRRHFLIEVNPPRCRVIDLNSRNGIHVNGERVEAAELYDGDELRAGHTVFRVRIPPADEPQMPVERTVIRPSIESPREESPTIDFAPDRTIPGYRIQAELGRGAMGVVYHAVRLADNLPVAIKTIAPAAGTEGRMVARFLREAKTLSALSHPNIVSCLDSGTLDPLIYLVMELVDGSDLLRMVRTKGPLPTAPAVRVVCGLLAGLAHAHAAGIVHRDVKPSNVLLGRTPAGQRVKVADFGLARAYDDCNLSGVTMQGEVAGTPAYMAPEQVTHFRDVKPAADQYSAAASLYFLLTDCHPHNLPREPGRQLACIVSEKPVPIRERNAEISAELAAAIHRGLAREQSDRFPDVTAFRTALLPFAK